MSRIKSTFAIIVVSLFARGALAQTGVALLVQPGPQDMKLELQGSATVFNQGHTIRPDNDFKLTYYDGQGRYRFDPSQPLGPRVGFDATYLDIASDDPSLPDRLADVSIGYGMAIGRFGQWWAAASVGVGYAGNAPFDDSDAWYGKADVLVGRDLWGGTLLGVLDYDGNRSFAPDVPLPGVEFRSAFSPMLSYVIGLPFSSLTWKPNDTFELKLQYALTNTLGARAIYKFTPALQAYGALESIANPFHIDTASGDRRLFFFQDRVEVGLRIAPWQNLSIVGGVGYAFNQEFRSGFDSRNLKGVSRISDEPYFKLQVEWQP